MKFQATVGKQASANKRISAVSGLSSFPPRSLSSGPDSGARLQREGLATPPHPGWLRTVSQGLPSANTAGPSADEPEA